jgi:hypothetical protein
LSEQDGLFLAIKPKRGVSEKEVGETANEETKQMLESLSEFFGSRGFWFFFPVKKNKKLLVQRALLK